MKTIKKILPDIIIIASVIIITLLINMFVIINAIVPTASMSPTIDAESRLFGTRLFNTISRNDIIIFESPDDPSKLYIKRVIGLPGETLEIIEGKVYINSELLEETGTRASKEWGMTEKDNFGPYVIPADSYFVLGDNRNNSRDSRYWKNTFVTKDAIKGKAGLCYWPFSDFGIIK